MITWLLLLELLFSNALALQLVCKSIPLPPRPLVTALRLSSSPPEVPVIGTETASGATDYEAIIQQIQADKEFAAESAEREQQDKRRQVLQKRKDKEYEKYWDKQKELGKGSKEQATMKSYYAGKKKGGDARDATGIGEDTSWDYQAVPVSPRDGTASTVALGLAVLAALVVGKKVTSSGEPDVAKKKKVRNAINMPGVGIITVE